MIATMVKPVLGILFGYPLGSSQNGFFEQVTGACFGRAQPRLAFAESQLNRIEIRRVGRQIPQAGSVFFTLSSRPSTLCTDRLSSTTTLPGRRAGPSTWSREAANTSPLTAPLTLSNVPSLSRGQGGDERHVRAVVQGHGLVHPLAGRGPAVAAAIGQVSARLGHEHETNNIFSLNIFYEQAAQRYGALGVTLGSIDAFFAPPPQALHRPPGSGPGLAPPPNKPRLAARHTPPLPVPANQSSMLS